MNGILSAMLLVFGLDGGTLGVDVFVTPGAELGLGLAMISGGRDIGPLSLQLTAEAEWDLHDATLVPFDVALVRNTSPLSWLSLYGGVATNVTFERALSATENPETAVGFAAALRAGGSIQATDWLAFNVDAEWAVPLEPAPTPELLVEVGPSFSF